MSIRKRRRDQAFPEDDERLDGGAHQASSAKTIPTEEEAALLEKQREDREREVWEAIREAHYEAIEQLPLTLQRQLFLMRQLDEQSLNINSKLLPALQKYIKLREEMATRPDPQPQVPSLEETSVDENNDTAPAVSPIQESSLGNEQQQPGSSDDGLVNASFTKSPRQSTPSSVVPGSVPPEPNQLPPETTREILTHVAQMAEQLLRASQEKVNLAQANHDSVERHIRLLDQAIKEQEATLALDEIQNNTGVAIHLPELTAPEYNRRKADNRITDDYDLDLMHEDTIDIQPEPPKTKKKKGKDKGGRGQSAQHDSSSLTITLPATETANSNEEVYCYCRQVSFGKMIGCDNVSCKREWFHLGCVGLTDEPEGEWYCEDCREDM